MAFKLQLVDARNDSGIRAVSGVCNNSDEFRAQVDTVIRQLLKRGGWFGTEVLAKFCVYSCSITLPRYVGTLIGARICGAGYTPIHNNWYSIVGPNCQPWGYEFNGGLSLRDEGLFPTYRDILGTGGRYIAYHVTKRPDVGKTCTIYGFDANGQPLQTRASDGTWTNGITITATAAGGATLPAMTTVLVGKITSVVREETQGMCYLYQYDATNGLVDMAVYEPTETNPQYRRMKILNWCGTPKHQDDYDRNVATIDAMVKLEYIRLVNDNDFLIIDDLDSLRYGIQALKREENGDAQGAEEFWLKAVRELNFNDRIKTPYQQISVRVRSGAGFVANPI